MNRLHLAGLKAHHPLGFLAACGLLRCLSQTADDESSDRQSKEFGRIGLGWRIEDGKETVAVIHSEFPADISDVSLRVLHIAKRQRSSPAWTWSNKIDDRTRYSEKSRGAVDEFLENGTSRGDADMFAALTSDLLVAEKGKEKGKLRKTAFDLTSGQQAFLKCLKETANAAARKGKGQIEEALKGPWRYQDDDHSLGWDPQAQRLHALRGKAPKDDKENRSVRAAVLLASLALPLFPCFSVSGRLRTTGFHHPDSGEWFSWPIWREPISLTALRSLISHPFNDDLVQRGVQMVYRCRIVHTGGSEGNYRVFGHPEERRWPKSVGERL